MLIVRLIFRFLSRVEYPLSLGSGVKLDIFIPAKAVCIRVITLSSQEANSPSLKTLFWIIQNTTFSSSPRPSAILNPTHWTVPKGDPWDWNPEEQTTYKNSEKQNHNISVHTLPNKLSPITKLKLRRLNKSWYKEMNGPVVWKYWSNNLRLRTNC